MQYLNLNNQGLVDRTPEDLNQLVEASLDHWIDKLAVSGAEQWNFLSGASLLAAEVYTNGLEWKSIASRYKGAGLLYAVDADEDVLDDKEADRCLELAWQWARWRAAPRTNLLREWIWVYDERHAYHIPTCGVVDMCDFGPLFTDVRCELLLDPEDLLLAVDKVVCDGAREAGFYQVDEDTVLFNAVSQGLSAPL